MEPTPNLHSLIESTNMRHYAIADRMGMRPDVFSRMLRSAPKSESVTRRLIAVLVGQLGLTSRSEIMKAINRTRELEEERKMNLWQDLMKQVEEDRKQEARVKARAKSGNGNGKVRKRSSNK